MLRRLLVKLALFIPLALSIVVPIIAPANAAVASGTTARVVVEGAAPPAVVARSWYYWGTYPTKAECRDVGDQLIREGKISNYACSYVRGKYDLRVYVDW